MADINKEASWVTARLLEVGNATNDGVNVLITDANIQYYNAGGLANTLGINKGGTNATTAADARTNLGVPSTGDVTSAINTAIAPKADKVTGATSGNFAGLDANGDLTDSGSKASDFMPALASGVTPGDIAVIGSNSNIVDSGKSFADIYDSSMIHKTASGAIVTIEDGADNVPVKQMQIAINPVQAGSGDPSPSNVREITGWTGANVIRRKNLITGYYQGTKEINGITYTPQADGTIIATGTATADSAYAVINNANNLPKERIYFSGCPSGGSVSTYDIRCSRYEGAGQTYDYGDGNHVDNLTYASVRMTIFVKSGYAIPSNAPLVFKPMISFSPCHYDDFVNPYATGVNTTYPITFPTEAGTVYGGNLVIHEDGSGTLTVDWTYKRLQGTVIQYPGTGYELMYYMPGWQGGETHINGNGTAYDASLRMSNMLKSVANVAGKTEARSERGTFSLAEGTSTAVNRLYGVYPTGVSSASDMSTWLTNNECYIAYKLQRPKTYNLTALQVMQTLLGLNNIWADTGEISSMTYRADPTLSEFEAVDSIRKTIAPIEDGETASQAYAVGAFLYRNGTLYKVTSAISSGGAFTVGTNINATTVAEQLIALA